MGQRRIAKPQADDASKRPVKKPKSSNTVLAKTTTPKREVSRAQRRVSEDVNLRATQHLINIPVNKSKYNGYKGQQFVSSMQVKRPNGVPPQTLRVIPIGGLGEMGIGKNMMAIEYDDEIIIIDMGFLFPGSDYPGINYITPDISYLEKKKHMIKANVFTHGHLDHIGSFRHFIERLPAPVYASKFTLGMLKKNFEESGSDYKPEYIEMNPETHEVIQVSKHFSIELVRVNHSIPDSTAVIVRTPLGVLVDTGDWRFEEDPVDGKKFDLERLTEVAAKEGILLLMNESTNCESDGTHTHGEKDIQRSIGQIMSMYDKSRIVISLFSSQLHRMQLILEEAARNNRKVAFAGYSMLNEEIGRASCRERV